MFDIRRRPKKKKIFQSKIQWNTKATEKEKNERTKDKKKNRRGKKKKKKKSN